MDITQAQLTDALHRVRHEHGALWPVTPGCFCAETTDAVWRHLETLRLDTDATTIRPSVETVTRTPPVVATVEELRNFAALTRAVDAPPDSYDIARGVKSGHLLAWDHVAMVFDATTGQDVDADSPAEADSLIDQSRPVRMEPTPAWDR